MEKSREKGSLGFPQLNHFRIKQLSWNRIAFYPAIQHHGEQAEKRPTLPG